MSSDETVDTLEIADLEQDIGGVHAVEAGEAHLKEEGIVGIMFYMPK